MDDVQLSLAVIPSERTRPIIERAVRPEGIALAITAADPAEIFWRQLKFAEFDVSEMSMSSLLALLARGDRTWVGLPVFTSRQFFHTGMLVRADAGIERPEDLRDKRIGVPEYQQTAALWVRGALQHEWGLPPEALDWYMERAETHSHGGSTGFRPPPGVRFQRIPLDKSIASILVDGELDATAFYVPERTVLDRSAVDLRGHPRVRTLFPDPLAEGIRYYQKTRLFPINHGMVVRRSILERHPWVALNLFRAFQTAQERALTQARQIVEPYFRLGVLPAAAQPALASDAYAYGVQANREVLETIARYSHEQGLTPRVVALEEVFAANTLDL